MKIGIHEITFQQGAYLDHVTAFAKAGWRHFEINLWAAWAHVERHGIAPTAALTADHGLTCVGATGLGMRAFKDGASRAADVDQIKRYGEVMAALKCRPLVVGCDAPDAGSRDTFDADLNRMADHVRTVADGGSAFGVTLAIEVNWCRMCRSFRTAAEVVRRVDRANVGVVWDPAHFYSTPSRREDLDALQGRIVHAHLNDMRSTPHEVLNVNSDRVMPGSKAGVLPLRQWIDRITAAGYDGYHCVELFDAELHKQDITASSRDILEGCRRIWPDADF